MAEYNGNEIVITPSPRNEHTGNLSKMYRNLSDSPAGTAYDAINAGLYLTAPFTGGVTLIPAMTMTGIQGIGAAADVYENGWNLNNGIDIASTIPGFRIGEYLVGKSMPWIMKQLGKSTKYTKHFTKYKPTKESIKAGNIEIGKSWPTWWQAAQQDSKYIPGASVVYGEEFLNHGLNIGQIINDMHDDEVESKGTGGQFTFPTNQLVKNQKQLLGNRKRNPSTPKSSRPMYNPNRIINKAQQGLKFNTYESPQHNINSQEGTYVPQIHFDKEDDFTLSTFNTLDEIDTKTQTEPTQIIPQEFIPTPPIKNAYKSEKTEPPKNVYKGTPKGNTPKKYTNKNDFIKDLSTAYLNLGINPELVKLLVAQAGGESAWGKSTIGNYNFGNIHATNKNGNRVGGWTGDIIFGTDHDANHIKYNVGFRSYNSIEEFSRDKWKLLSSPRYGLTKDMDPKEAIERIVKGGYAEDKDYKNKLYKWFKSI